MGTEVLRPRDCLTDRIRDPPCRRRNYYGHNSPAPNYYCNSSSPRFNRKLVVRSDRSEQKKRQAEPSISKRSSSADDLKSSRSHPQNNNNHHLFMEKVTILRRGESLDSKIKSRETEAASKNDVHGGEMVVTGTDRLGPGPEMVSKQIRIVDLMSPVARKCDVYAGSAFAVSPAPSSLPLPSFSKKKHMSVDDSATRGLRRLLRLDF